MPLRDVFSPHCSSPCTPMIAPLKTPLSSSWITQTTLQSSVSSRKATSLLKQTLDKRLSSWLSGAVLTTWSSTRSKQWRWSWTSGETPLISPHSPSSTAQWRHSGSWDHHLSGPEVGHSHRLHCKKGPTKVVLPSSAEEVWPATGAAETVLLSGHRVFSVTVRL